MRSIFMFAAVAAVISFTGCCGTGGGHLGKCKLGSCLLGGGKGAVAQRALQGTSCGSSVGGCGCSSGACGSGSVMTTSAPYACDGGCGGSAPMSVPSSGGCSSCSGGGAVEYAPAQYAPPVQYAPTQYAPPVEYAPAQSSGCSACDSASASKPKGFLFQRSAKSKLPNNKGMGLFLKEKGQVCDEAAASSRRSGTKGFRSLGQSARSNYGLSSGSECDSCSGGVVQTVAQMPGGGVLGGAVGGRRISTGILPDLRAANDARFSKGGLLGLGKTASLRTASLRTASLRSGAPREGAFRSPHSGCGLKGCGLDGKLCDKCTKLAHEIGLGHPYGGAIPHTNPAVGQPPQSGIAPQYAYPYYTTRGPRDFLRDNPPSIGY